MFNEPLPTPPRPAKTHQQQAPPAATSIIRKHLSLFMFQADMCAISAIIKKMLKMVKSNVLQKGSIKTSYKVVTVRYCLQSYLMPVTTFALSSVQFPIFSNCIYNWNKFSPFRMFLEAWPSI